MCNCDQRAHSSQSKRSYCSRGLADRLILRLTCSEVLSRLSAGVERRLASESESKGSPRDATRS